MPLQRKSFDDAPGLRSRVRYRFDNLLARGTWAVLLWLGVVTLAAVLVSSGLLAAFGVDFAGSQETSWLEDFWQSLLRVFDPGTMAADVGWGRRILALLVTIFGILIAGTLIGLIANGVEQRVEEMRRGRSTVVETGHAVILGGRRGCPWWSSSWRWPAEGGDPTPSLCSRTASRSSSLRMYVRRPTIFMAVVWWFVGGPGTRLRPRDGAAPSRPRGHRPGRR